MAKKRAAGEGSIYRKKNGLWAAVLTVGYDGSGRRRRKYLYGATQSEVREKLQQQHADVRAGDLPAEPTRMRMAEFLDHWLIADPMANSAPNTAKVYRKALPHIKAFIGGIRLDRLLEAHVETMFSRLATEARGPRMKEYLEARSDLSDVKRAHALARLSKRKDFDLPLAPRTRANIRNALSRALQYAKRYKLVSRNLVREIPTPRVREELRSFLDCRQLRRFLEEAGRDKYAVFWLIAVHTGARRGELLGLRWASVNWDESRLRIDQQWDPERRVLAPLKTGSSVREIDLDSDAMDALRAHRVSIGAIPMPGAFIFASPESDAPIHPSTLTKRLKRILKHAELPPETTIHGLRHASASALGNDGELLHVVQERLGHSDIRQTRKYVHSTPEARRKAAQKLGALLRR